MTTTLAPDTAIGGRYVLEQRIAIGGMGEVWRARDDVLSRTVAVKVLKAEYAADPAFLTRFRNEAKHTAALSHPGIANVFDYGEIDDMPYLVMEYVTGEPLSHLLAREHRLPPDRTLDIVGQAGLALQAAHGAGVVHRDVKPGNVLIRPDGVVKMTDFGVARAIDAAPLTRTGLVVGTAAYLSPEQAAGKPAIPASDVYSLGLIAYECLAGERPFEADGAVAMAMAHLHQQPRPLPDDVPPIVADFVAQALAKEPERRHPSAADFGRTALALAASLRTPPTTDARTPDATTAVPTAPTATAQPTPTKVLTTVTPVVSEDEADAVAVVSPVADDTQRRRVRNAMIAVGAVVVLLGFLALRSCGGTSNGNHPAPASTPSATKSAVPTVQVDPATYVGKPADFARTALTALGLQVRSTSTVSTQPTGTVVSVSPSGAVPRGSTVTLTVAVAPTPTHKGKGDHGGKGDH